MTAHERIAHLTPQIISDLNGLTIDDRFKITIKCHCGKEVTLGARSLIRRWSTAPYKCKSCHVKTYANNPERIEKFKASHASSMTTERRNICATSGAKAWDDPTYKQKMSDLLKERNKSDPRIIDGRKKALDTFMANGGKEHLAKIRTAQLGQISTIEATTMALLKEWGINFMHQYLVGYTRFDIYIPSKNILLELQGDYWHRNTQEADSAKATYASNLGYIVKHIWEHEFGQLGKIEHTLRQMLGIEPPPQIDFNFEDLTLHEITNLEARIFYGKYHYLPAIAKSGYHIGCKLGNEIIASCTFSHITRKQIADRLLIGPKSVRELGRFCIGPSYHKRNFATWFLSRATKLFKQRSPGIKVLISFADTTLHDGTIYKAAGWVEDGMTARNYQYRSPDGYLAHKKPIWDRAKKLGITENEYASRFGYIKVWSKPKRRYLLHLM